jgi:hypothetical protein
MHPCICAGVYISLDMKRAWLQHVRRKIKCLQRMHSAPCPSTPRHRTAHKCNTFASSHSTSHSSCNILFLKLRTSSHRRHSQRAVSPHHVRACMRHAAACASQQRSQALASWQHLLPHPATATVIALRCRVAPGHAGGRSAGNTYSICCQQQPAARQASGGRAGWLAVACPQAAAPILHHLP